MLRTPLGPTVLTLALVGLAVGSRPLSGQETPPSDQVRCLTLEEAERLAVQGNRRLAADGARADALQARAAGAGGFRWPRMAVEAGATRSDDPVAAFGTRLRQARFTESDFDPDVLNRPDPVKDWAGAVGVRWSALDPGRWAELTEARHAARAAGLGTERAADAVRFRTRVLYLEALRADAALEAARTGEDAARSSADLVRRRRQEGILTDAEVLQAEAALAGARARTADAERAVGDARGRLALHLGLPEGTRVVPVDARLSLDPGPPAGEGSLTGRADLRASLARVDAAGAAVARARASRLPRVDAFARVSTHAPDPLEGREANLTLGVQLSLPLFTGGEIGAAVDEARALERATRLEHEDRIAAARTERAEARRAVDATRRGAEAAEAAQVAADEAARLVRRRFQEGLATTAELLQAEARAAEFRTAAVDARASHQQALAFLAFTTRGSTPDDTDDS